MKKKILFVILLSVLVCTLFVFSSCGKEKTNETGEKSDVKPDWSVSFEQEKDVFDINDVELTFYIEVEVITEDVFREFDPEIDMSSLPYEEGTEEYEQAYQAFYAEELRQYERDTAICPEYADLYFTSFGNEFPIKRLSKEEIKEETTGQPFWKHEEKIKLPEEVFINEYGAVCFRVNIISKSSSSVDASENRGGISRQVFYHKTGNTVEISREDLQEQDKYADNEYAFGVLFKKARTDYCSVRSISPSAFKPTDTTGNLTMDMYLGRTYPKEEGYVSTKLYFVSENTGEKGKIFLKDIDYSSDEYLCDVEYDYYGRADHVIFNHKETVTIPKEYVIGEERVAIILYGQKEGEEEKPLSYYLFKYTYINNENEVEEYDPSYYAVKHLEETKHRRNEYYHDSVNQSVIIRDDEELKEFLKGKE